MHGSVPAALGAASRNIAVVCDRLWRPTATAKGGATTPYRTSMVIASWCLGQLLALDQLHRRPLVCLEAIRPLGVEYPVAVRHPHALGRVLVVRLGVVARDLQLLSECDHRGFLVLAHLAPHFAHLLVGATHRHRVALELRLGPQRHHVDAAVGLPRMSPPRRPLAMNYPSRGQ